MMFKWLQKEQVCMKNVKGKIVAHNDAYNMESIGGILGSVAVSLISDPIREYIIGITIEDLI